MRIDSTKKECVDELSWKWLNEMKSKCMDLKREEESIMSDVGMVNVDNERKSGVINMEAQHRKEILAGECNGSPTVNTMETSTINDYESTQNISIFQSQQSKVSEKLTHEFITDTVSPPQSRNLTSAKQENSTHSTKLDGKNVGEGNNGRHEDGFEMQSSRLYDGKSYPDNQLVCKYIPEVKTSSSTDVCTSNLNMKNVATTEMTEMADNQDKERSMGYDDSQVRSGQTKIYQIIQPGDENG